MTLSEFYQMFLDVSASFEFPVSSDISSSIICVSRHGIILQGKVMCNLQKLLEHFNQ